MASFTQAYNLVADAEGGYQQYSQDSGNYNSLGQLVGTNWGISAPVYETYLGYPPSSDDMRSMTKSTAKAIYKSRFWDSILGDQIRNQSVANILFDGHVNHGRHGIRIAQRVLGVDDDAVVGPITLKALNNANPTQFVRDYAQARKDFYRYLASSNPSQQIFLNGWLNRLKMFTDNLPGPGEAFVSLAAAAVIYYLITNQ